MKSSFAQFSGFFQPHPELRGQSWTLCLCVLPVPVRRSSALCIWLPDVPLLTASIYSDIFFFLAWVCFSTSYRRYDEREGREGGRRVYPECLNSRALGQCRESRAFRLPQRGVPPQSEGRARESKRSSKKKKRTVFSFFFACDAKFSHSFRNMSDNKQQQRKGSRGSDRASHHT